MRKKIGWWPGDEGAPVDPNVILYLDSVGAVNDQTAFTDKSYVGTTMFGGGKYTNAQSRGGNAVSMTRTAGQLEATNNAAYNFGTGPATLEAWVYLTGAAKNTPIYRFDDFQLSHWSATTVMGWWGAGAIMDGTVPLNEWVHIASTRAANGDTAAFVNKVQTGSGSDSHSSDATRNIEIMDADFSGYMDSMRVWDKVADVSEFLN